MRNAETYFVLFDEDQEGYVGTRSNDGWEAVLFYGDYTEPRVVKFSSAENAQRWNPPAAGYDPSASTIIKVVVQYSAETVEA